MTTIPEVAATPEVMEREFSLMTAVTRLDFLSRRDNVVVDAPNDSADDDDDWASFKAGTNTQLDAEEALELLALGEVVARKAHDNRQLGITAALRGGADWPQIARALAVTPRAAWEQHVSWLDAQAAARRSADPGALTPDEVAVARTRAGRRPAW